MPDDTSQALAFIAMMNDPADYRRRVDEFGARKAAAEEAEASARRAASELEAKRAASEQQVAAAMGRLSAAKADHDLSAMEAKSRIETGQKQAEELLRVKAIQDERERDLRIREAKLKSTETEIAAALHRFKADQDAVAALKASLESKHEKLREIVSGR